MNRDIEVTWHDEVEGYTDVFPVEEFAEEVARAERIHQVRGPKGGVYHARYNLSIKGRTATLDYAAFADFNERNGMYLGVMTLEFADSHRDVVKAMWWNQKSLSAVEATVNTVDSNGTPAPAKTPVAVQLATATQLLRPGQIEFRKRLGHTYGSCCCITRCPVPWVLEAAHIIRFKDDASNNEPSNGLLLRSDLHALFDAKQMAINPKTRVVFFAPEAKAWPEYAHLHGKQKMAQP